MFLLQFSCSKVVIENECYCCDHFCTTLDEIHEVDEEHVENTVSIPDTDVFSESISSDSSVFYHTSYAGPVKEEVIAAEDSNYFSKLLDETEETPTQHGMKIYQVKVMFNAYMQSDSNSEMLLYTYL